MNRRVLALIRQYLEGASEEERHEVSRLVNAMPVPEALQEHKLYVLYIRGGFTGPAIGLYMKTHKCTEANARAFYRRWQRMMADDRTVAVGRPAAPAGAAGEVPVDGGGGR